MSSRNFSDSAVLALILLVATSANGSEPPDPDDAACDAVQKALASVWHLPPDDPSHPRWYCSVRPLLATDEYIVLVLQDSANSMYVGPHGGWYAVRRRDNVAFYMPSTAVPRLEVKELILMPKPPDAAASAP